MSRPAYGSRAPGRWRLLAALLLAGVGVAHGQDGLAPWRGGFLGRAGNEVGEWFPFARSFPTGSSSAPTDGPMTQIHPAYVRESWSLPPLDGSVLRQIVGSRDGPIVAITAEGSVWRLHGPTDEAPLGGRATFVTEHLADAVTFATAGDDRLAWTTGSRLAWCAPLARACPEQDLPYAVVPRFAEHIDWNSALSTDGRHVWLAGGGRLSRVDLDGDGGVVQYDLAPWKLGALTGGRFGAIGWGSRAKLLWVVDPRRVRGEHSFFTLVADIPHVVWSAQPPLELPPEHGPYAGHVLVGCHSDDVLFRVFLEEVDGVVQGAVIPFMGLRLTTPLVPLGPRGELVVGEPIAKEDWGRRPQGLVALRYAGSPPFELLAVRRQPDGLDVEFTEEVDLAWAGDPSVWTSTPAWTADEFAVTAAVPSPDLRRIRLVVDGVAPGVVLDLRLDPAVRSRAGKPLHANEARVLITHLPAAEDAMLDRPTDDAPNTLSDAARAAGWELLFDGRTTLGWRGFRRSDVPDGWRVVDGTLARLAPAGDLITDEQFQDFELAFDWKVAEGGNSGLFFHVSEDAAQPWHTGPEMQLLDDEGHADGADPLTSAGANYGLHAPLHRVTRPAGTWNEARLRVRGDQVEHWLNGVLLLEYWLGSPEWVDAVAASKFARFPTYGRRRRGHLALQDHGDPVWFRNVRIRRL